MNIDELEESLARPTPAVIETLRAVGGDIVVLGAGGKMGPSLCRMAQRAKLLAGSNDKVHAVSRFSDRALRDALESDGVHTITCDLLDRAAVGELPDAAAVIFMAGTKFGTTGDQARTWALNSLVPGMVAMRYAGVPTVVFSSGNIYPMVAPGQAVTEQTAPAPVGEYAWSVLARERIFEHFANTTGTPVVLYRLNYAAELRYGVPLDLARDVYQDRPVDLSMGWFNAIWQGDANAIALRSLALCCAPASILNVTGPDTLSVKALAERFGRLFGRQPTFVGSPAPTALLSDASKAWDLYGPPTVGIDELTQWIADWLEAGHPTHDKPTHFSVRDGVY